MRIVKWVGARQERFDELFSLFLNDEYRVVQRAAWPVSYSAIAHPALLKKHWKKFVENIDKPGLHEAVRRNSIRILVDIELPVPYHGAIMDACFRFLESPGESLAVKVYSMDVLYKLSKIYPDIFPELKYLIEEQMPHQSPGFRSKGKKILKSGLSR